jgi:GAF domain-containing protein
MLAAARAVDLQTVLDALTETAAHLCEADMAAITRPKGSTFYYATSYGFPADYLEFIRTVPLTAERGSVMGRTLIEGKAMQVPDVLADPEYMYLDHQKKTGVRTLLGVPLLREGSPIGVVLLGSAGDTRTLAVHGLRIATHCREAYSPVRPPLIAYVQTGQRSRGEPGCSRTEQPMCPPNGGSTRTMGGHDVRLVQT